MKAQIINALFCTLLPMVVMAQQSGPDFPQTLTGKNFKLLSVKKMSGRFRVTLDAGMVFPGKNETRSIANTLIENQFHSENHEIIQSADSNKAKRCSEISFGLGVGYRIFRGLELNAGIAQSKSALDTYYIIWSTPHQTEWPHNQPNSVEKKISTSIVRWQTRAGAVWHFGHGRIRPMVGTGLHFTSTTAKGLGHLKSKVGSYALAGMEILVGKNLSLVSSYQICTGAPPWVQAGLGFVFK